MSKKISIIYVFKNRDSIRVKRCLDSLLDQTFKDFEVLFIDNGSEKIYSLEIEKLVSSYSFVTYLRVSTDNKPWNRSYGINVAIKMAESSYLLFGDIDLIYSPNVLEYLNNNANLNTAIYGSMFILNKMFDKWNYLFKLPLSNFTSTESPVGAFLFLNKIWLIEMRGFDEYYCFWGVEDRDIFTRIKHLGIELIQMDKYKYPIFHQWHPIVSDRKKSFFPEKWWDDINIYYILNKNNIIRNDENWGQIINDEDRPIFKAQKAKSLKFSKHGSSYKKAQDFDSILSAIDLLNKNEYLEIILLKRKIPKFVFFIIKYFNLVARNICLPIGLDYIENVEREKYYYPQNDVYYLIWRLIKHEKIIKDYEIFDECNKMIIKLMKKENYL